MAPALLKLSLINLKSFSNQLLTTETHSDVATIFLLCAKHGTGKTTDVKSSFLPTLTSDTTLKKSGITQK